MLLTDPQETKKKISKSVNNPPATTTLGTDSGSFAYDTTAPFTSSNMGFVPANTGMHYHPGSNPITNGDPLPQTFLHPDPVLSSHLAIPCSSTSNGMTETLPESNVNSETDITRVTPLPQSLNRYPTDTDGIPKPNPLSTTSESYPGMEERHSEPTGNNGAWQYTQPSIFQPLSNQLSLWQPYLNNPLLYSWEHDVTTGQGTNAGQFEFPSASKAHEEWAFRKFMHKESNSSIDELMKYQGLEEVKQQFLDIKSKVDCCKEQGRDLKSERFNIVFQGNPGTGKTTIARLYAKFLHSVGILSSEHVEETTGVKVAAEGTLAIKETIEEMIEEGGGVLYVDEAYQLTALYNESIGRLVLDVILTEMENNVGKLAVIFVGYKNEMESFFEHNPGLPSRIPYTMHFADFTDNELGNILRDNITKQYKGKMRVENGMYGLYMRIAIRRLAQTRGSRGFGNARAVENLLAKISHRQAKRLAKEKRYLGYTNKKPDFLLFQKEDLIGPDPSIVANESEAYVELQKLIGLDRVKESVQSMIGMIRLNYHRELRERSPIKISLNQLFVGDPGTGKTTVAKLYGRIMADLGYLSNGEVVLKTPADFIGECLGKSEAKTKKILEATVGKVLVIDEAYMLDSGDPIKEQDKFKASVIDTMVSMIQGVPGEDRCIILVGYENKIIDMFNNANEGFSRRFPVQQPFRFENFDISQLEQILRLKLDEQEFKYTDQAISVAREVLERSLMRPNFTNAGEVDALLSRVKMNYEMRLSKMPPSYLDLDMEVAAADFDPDYERGSRIDCRKIMKGLVHNSIAEKFVRYQNQYIGAKKRGINPRDQIPTTFIFRGPPGTGKTTAARKMGEIFYSMGFLSTPDVIECSVADLVGQYVGQTVPKTRKKLQESIGRVLFIDEAYRLMYGEYAAEAVDELLNFLTQATYKGKIIVILAGYTEDIRELLWSRPKLSSLFPEEIVFDDIPPEDCVALLARELKLNNFESEEGFLKNPSSDCYVKVKRLFRAMELIPYWSNARDVRNLSKQIIGRLLESADDNSINGTKALDSELILQCMSEMITQHRDRSINMGSNKNAPFSQQPHPPAHNTSTLREEDHRSATKYSTSVETRDQARGHPSMSQASAVNTRINGPRVNGASRNSPQGKYKRDDGVSEAVWHELCEAKNTESAERDKQAAEIKKLQRQLHEARNSGDDMRSNSILEQLEAIQKAIQEKERAQRALATMKRCVQGYAWNRVGGGWRCEGGSHFATDAEVQARLG